MGAVRVHRVCVGAKGTGVKAAAVNVTQDFCTWKLEGGQKTSQLSWRRRPRLPPGPDQAVFCCAAPLGAFTLGIATPALLSKTTWKI